MGWVFDPIRDVWNRFKADFAIWKAERDAAEYPPPVSSPPPTYLDPPPSPTDIRLLSLLDIMRRDKSLVLCNPTDGAAHRNYFLSSLEFSTEVGADTINTDEIIHRHRVGFEMVHYDKNFNTAEIRLTSELISEDGTSHKMTINGQPNRRFSLSPGSKATVTFDTVFKIHDPVKEKISKKDEIQPHRIIRADPPK